MKNLGLWIAALVVVVLDRLSKYAIMTTLPLGTSLPLWPGVFHFTHIHNRGAAFSLFAEGGSFILPWISVLVSVGIAVYGLRGPTLASWESWGYGLVLGGAVGNGIDRVFAGEVIDFIDVRIINFAVFNLADIAINLGVACLLWASFQSSKSKEM